MQDKNRSSRKSMLNIDNLTHSKGFSAFTAALLAITLGLIFGFIVMLIAAPGNAFAGFRYVLLGGFSRFAGS